VAELSQVTGKSVLLIPYPHCCHIHVVLLLLYNVGQFIVESRIEIDKALIDPWTSDACCLSLVHF